jgi:hypothetical protein
MVVLQGGFNVGKIGMLYERREGRVSKNGRGF